MQRHFLFRLFQTPPLFTESTAAGFILGGSIRPSLYDSRLIRRDAVFPLGSEGVEQHP